MYNGISDIALRDDPVEGIRIHTDVHRTSSICYFLIASGWQEENYLHDENV